MMLNISNLPDNEVRAAWAARHDGLEFAPANFDVIRGNYRRYPAWVDALVSMVTRIRFVLKYRHKLELPPLTGNTADYQFKGGGHFRGTHSRYGFKLRTRGGAHFKGGTFVIWPTSSLPKENMLG